MADGSEESRREALDQLRDILINLYPDRRDAQRVLSDARVDPHNVDLDGSASRRWYAVLVDADRQGRVHSIVEVARREYPYNRDLLAKGQAILATLTAKAKPPSPPPSPANTQQDAPSIDALIFTALREELDAVLALGEGGQGGWTQVYNKAGFPYHHREYPRKNGSFRIAAAGLGEMGEMGAASQVSRLVEELSPPCLAICGICTGRRGAVSLGDVIVADRVYRYDHGKLVVSLGEKGQRNEDAVQDITSYHPDARWIDEARYFSRDPSWSQALVESRPPSLDAQCGWLLWALAEEANGQGPSPLKHRDRARRCPRWRDVLESLEGKQRITIKGSKIELTDDGRREAERLTVLHPDGPAADPPLKVHVGAIASGSTFRKDPQLFDRPEIMGRGTIGIETEVATIGSMAAQMGALKLIAKAVSDYGDTDKSDDFRGFACRASATFVLAFLARHL